MGSDDIKDKAADLVKKVLTVGVGAIFLTEEGLRNLMSEIKLPKELLGGMLDSAARTKNEFLSKLSSDVMQAVTSKMDPEGLVQEIIKNNDFEFNIKLKIHPKGHSQSNQD